MGIAKQILEIIAATADIERFGEWKGKLEDALEELKTKKISKKNYEKQKKTLKDKLKKATELLEKSKDRLEKAKKQERGLL